MARANRHYIPGYVWHLTHRCHKREFLLKFSKDKGRWLQWLFEAKKRFGLCILNYMVTSNHIHVLVLDSDDDEEVIPKSIQLIAGRTGQEYNQRKNRRGAFWKDRYHATAVENDSHLIQCLVYIDLNMVRAGVVQHPSEWPFGGILHHLLDYEQVVRRISGNVAEGGFLYFVREPIARDECQSGNLWSNYIEKIYCMINSLLMTPSIRVRLWPGKIKAEDTSNIALHMFKDGISTKVFRELEARGFVFVFTRRYNRRVSSFLSYVENKWLAPLRKDIYGNTLFSICMRKV